VKPWLESRLAKGVYHALLQELQQTDKAGYRYFLRMDAISFDFLVQKVSPYIARIYVYTAAKMHTS
jgi:hypothetical protein